MISRSTTTDNNNYMRVELNELLTSKIGSYRFVSSRLASSQLNRITSCMLNKSVCRSIGLLSFLFYHLASFREVSISSWYYGTNESKKNVGITTGGELREYETGASVSRLGEAKQWTMIDDAPFIITSHPPFATEPSRSAPGAGRPRGRPALDPGRWPGPAARRSSSGRCGTRQGRRRRRHPPPRR